MVPFFPNFVKLDALSSMQRVLDVALGATNVYAITQDRENQRHLYSMGCGLLGQLGDGSTLNKCFPVDISKMFDSQVVEVAAGGFHALALTESGKVYGWGKKSKAQLGTKHRKGDIKFNTKPTPINLASQASVSKLYCGGLFSLAQVATLNDV
jgi:alpha-tubulin suppressor-like RCC1 family protein